jgi:hypothetical protein
MLVKVTVVYIEFVDKIGAGEASDAIIVTFFSSAPGYIIFWFCDLA